MDHIELPFVKMSTNAVTPTRATEGSVGLDFYSPANYIIPPCSQLLIPTQIKLGIPLGHYGRLASKSGLAILHHLHVGAGVIDPDYTGEAKVLLINTASHAHSIIRGDPIAQINFGKSITSHTKEGKGTFTHYQGEARLWLSNYLYICLISQ